MGDEGTGNWEPRLHAESLFPVPRSRFPVPGSPFPVPRSRFPVPGSPFASSPCPGRSDLPVRDREETPERRASAGIVLGLDSSAMREDDRTTDR